MVELRPMSEAPRDRTCILAYARQIEEERWEHLSGRPFVIYHEGHGRLTDIDLGWAMYPGFGGAPDRWFAGWLPLPIPYDRKLHTQGAEHG